MPNKGILLIATREEFIRAGNGAARSIRESNPGIAIDMFCDQPEFVQRDLFDRVEQISDPHRRSKVDYLEHTRFDRTLYLDTDIRVVADISNLFDLLDRFDLALAHAHARNQWKTQQSWRETLPDAFPQYNGGVILYNSARPEVIDFMRRWKAVFHETGFHKDQVTLRELLWKSDLRLHTLPPEYNIRYEKYLDVWAETEADPKILHFERFKDELEGPSRETTHGRIKRKTLASRVRKILTSAPGMLRKPAKQKVYCIGFHKTGTTSLSRALQDLGYRTIHGDGRKTWRGADEGVTLTGMIDAGNFDLPTLSLFDAFSDNPYFSIWKQLDARRDGKFILTMRDPEKWIDSCCRYYKDRRVRHMRQWMFGEHADPNSSPEARQAWLDRYQEHNDAVLAHFEGRRDLLVLDVTREQGWDRLCEFLGKPVPEKPFPHSNKGAKRESAAER